jgi:hypothetical protein
MWSQILQARGGTSCYHTKRLPREFDHSSWLWSNPFFRHPNKRTRDPTMGRTVVLLVGICCIGTVHAFAPAPLVLKNPSHSSRCGTRGLNMQLRAESGLQGRRSLFFKAASLVVQIPTIIFRHGRPRPRPHHHTTAESSYVCQQDASSGPRSVPTKLISPDT